MAFTVGTHKVHVFDSDQKMNIWPRWIAVHAQSRFLTSSGNHGKSLKKSSMHGKIMDFEKA